MKKKSILVLLGLLVISIFLPAQEETTEQETSKIHHQITVTATRIETSPRETGSSVTIITKEELAQTQEPLLLDALKKVAGISIIQAGPAGMASSVFLRGANSEHTLIMIDGVQVNDPISPSRSADLAHLQTSNIERVEILAGPQSPLYGSDALGGVINIITSPGKGKPHLEISGLLGSWMTSQVQVSTAGEWEKVAFSLSLTHFQNEGISAANSIYPGNSEKDGYRNLSFAGRTDLTLSPNNKFSFFLRAYNARSDIDNFGGPYGDDPNNQQDSQSLISRLSWRNFLFGPRWEQLLSINFTHHRRENKNSPDEFHPSEGDKGIYKSNFVHLDWQHNLYLHPNNTITFGIDWKQESGQSEYTSFNAWGNYNSFFPQEKAHSVGFYGQDFIRIEPYFFSQIGIRWDKYAHFGTAFTYRLSPTIIFPATNTQLKLSLGSAFKAPSLYQLYAPGSTFGPIGNPHLQPEKSKGWEVGIQQTLMSPDKLQLNLGYFSQNFTNLIQFDYAQGYINTGRARSRGWEVSSQLNLKETVQVHLNYTHLQSLDLQTNEPLLRRPQELLNARLLLQIKKNIHSTITFTYYGQREDLDYSTWPASRVSLSPFKLLNFNTSYNLNPHLQLFLKIDNLLDEKFELIKGYGAYGLSIYLGVKSTI